MHPTLVVIAFLAAALTACTGTPQIIQVPAAATPTPLEARPPSQFTVTGLARMEVTPDCADLELVVVADHRKSAKAAALADGRQRDLVARLVAAGVAERDIKLSTVAFGPKTTYGYSVYGWWSWHTWYRWDRTESRSFRATIKVSVTTRDFAGLSDLMDVATTAGVASMATRFRRENLDALKLEVRGVALTAARAKADQMAATLGFTVGPVVGVGEDQAGQLWGKGPQAARDQAVPNVTVVEPAVAMDGAAGVGGETEALSVGVSVSFEIAPA